MCKRTLTIIILLGMSLALLVGYHTIDSFASFVAAHISIPVETWLGALASRAPFPIFEALSLLSVSFLAVFLCRAAWRTAKQRNAAPLRTWLINAMLGVSACLFAFTLLWSPFYSVKALPDALSWPDTLHTANELTALCESLINRANVLREGLNEYKGLYALPYDHSVVMDMVPALVSDVEFVHSVPQSPKAFRYSELFTVFGIAGLYVPWTGEALVNTLELPVSIPFTACHEAAHSVGYAQEDDANFIAYLACMGGDRNFRYSGVISALYYAMNTLHNTDYSAWILMRPQMTQAVQSDFYAMNGFRTIDTSEQVLAGSRVADAFLRINGQDGLKNYGNMVNLLLGWEKETLRVSP